MATTHQTDPDVERLRQQLQREREDADRKIRKLEADAVYLRKQLIPYLRSLAAAVPFAPPPEPPA